MVFLLSWIILGPAKPHEDLLVCILEEGKVGPGVMHVNPVKEKTCPWTCDRLSNSPDNQGKKIQSSKQAKDQSTTDMRTGIKKRKRRNKQQNTVELAPSFWNRICPQDVVDAGMHLNPAKKNHSAWFSLTPSCDQKNTLQLLVEPYLQITMEGNPDVSILMKYIALQLKHVHQQEVGIFLNGKLLAPEMKLLDVVKQWIAIVDSERKITKIGSSAENFCVKLTYA
ncbi:unnamed protein product [Lactuca saligna]|uniref:Uncharacterized protein n=1 Tax=Lactuca saligna TaxID=75948 RepID=A0AA35Z3G1_LACSI|nr:unnamed protein product [Lactuca saligna]